MRPWCPPRYIWTLRRRAGLLLQNCTGLADLRRPAPLASCSAVLYCSGAILRGLVCSRKRWYWQHMYLQAQHRVFELLACGSEKNQAFSKDISQCDTLYLILAFKFCNLVH